MNPGILAAHYQSFSTGLLEELLDHPIALYRCPEGIDKGCFWQRNAALSMPGLKMVDAGGITSYVLSDKRGLTSLAQLYVVEIHVHNFRLGTDHPDKLIIDIDPPDNKPFSAVIAAAYGLKRILDGYKLNSYPKLTGGGGLHVVVPLSGAPTHEEVKAFSKKICERLVKENPDLYDDVPSRSKIYLDSFRNDPFATTICAWSPRTTSLVSTVLTWKDLAEAFPNQYKMQSDKLEAAYKAVAGRMHLVLPSALPNG